MRKILLIVLVLISIQNSFSQAPGYRGKRWILDYDLAFFPPLLAPNANFDRGLIKMLNFRHYVGLEYIVTPGGSFGVNAGFFSTGKTPYISSTQYSPMGYSYYSDGREELRITGKSIGFYYKFYKLKKKGFIAPLGNYSRLGYQAVISQGRFVTYKGKDKGIYEQESIQGFITYGWGKQFMIVEGLMFKAGFELGIPFHGIDERTLAAQYLFNFETGIAYLIH